ncbi:hypothetical protein HPP92_023242 [Vanilla planifolia]|uniref:LisH domain-containing protein n=1 Tax=Vanilla planifolia TaxID=51239 RepID=A0A835PSZ8_VANPL|nr:hypothetical protein HPP92_023242 [Vanilla planifolia]
MSQTNWEADKMLDVYIYDYFVKRNLQATAKAFQVEGKVSSDPVVVPSAPAIDAAAATTNSNATTSSAKASTTTAAAATTTATTTEG